MQQEDQLWYLLSRRLTGDASADEINTLKELIEDDPGKKKLVTLITWFYQIPTAEDSHEIQNAWSKHEQRLQ